MPVKNKWTSAHLFFPCTIACAPSYLLVHLHSYPITCLLLAQREVIEVKICGKTVFPQT